MKVAVLGASGFLGSNLIKLLTLHGHTVHGWSRQATEQSFSFDARDRALPRAWSSYDAIINAVGAGVQASVAQTVDELIESNLVFPARLVDFLTTHHFKGRLITFGSYFEIGNSKQRQPHTEAELVQTRTSVPNNYCASKRALTRWADSVTTDFHWVHLVLPTIYGPGEAAHRLLPYLLSCLKSNITPQLSSGHQIRQYVHVADVGEAVAAVIAGARMEPRILNMPGPDVCSIRQLAELAFAQAGHRLAPEAFGKIETRDTAMEYLALDGAQYAQLSLPAPHHNLKRYLIQYNTQHV